MCCPGLTTGWRNLFWCMPSPTVPRSTKRLLAHPRTTPSLKGLLAVGYRHCSPLSISRPQIFVQPALARSPWCESRLVQSSSRAACLSIPRPGPFCSLGSMASADMTSGMPSCFDRRGQGWRHNSMGLRSSRPTTRTSTGAFLRRHADMLALPRRRSRSFVLCDSRDGFGVLVGWTCLRFVGVSGSHLCTMILGPTRRRAHGLSSLRARRLGFQGGAVVVDLGRPDCWI